MKSRVVFMALLCLLLIFTGAMADNTPLAPEPVPNLVYSGQPQELYTNPDGVTYNWYWDADGNGTKEWSTSIPTAVNAGTYSYPYFLKDVTPRQVMLENVIAPADVTLIWEGLEEAPEIIEKEYNGQEQRLTAAFPTDFNSGELNCILTVSGKLTNVSQGVGEARADISNTSGSKTLCDQNYNITNRTHQFKITPLVAKLKWVNDQFTFDGEYHAPEATVENLIEGDSCTVTVEGEQIDVQTNAYTAKATELSNKNYVLPEKNEKKFKINPRELTITWDEKTTFEYDGEKHAPKIKEIGNCIEGIDCSMMVTITGAGTDADKYDAEATIPEDVFNYKFSAETKTTQEFEITKKKVTLLWEGLEEAPEVIEKEYNGEKQYLTAEFPSDFDSGEDACVLTVSGPLTVVGKEGTARADFSKKSGNKASCDKNYEITNRTQQFRITPRTITLLWDEKEFTYDGEPHPEATTIGVLEGQDVGLTVEGRQTNANPEDKPTYTATAKISNKNYKIGNEDEIELEFTIAKADPEYVEPEPLEESVISYTGSNLPLLKSIGSAIEPATGRWIFFSTYKDPEGTESEPQKFISTVPTGKDEGTYTITWYFYNNGNPENYNNGGSPENPLGTTTVTIAKDIAEITKDPEAIEGLKFKGNPQTLITAGESLDGTFMYFLDGAEEASDQLPQGRDAGEYTVWYYVIGDDIHADKGSFDKPLGPITVNIAKIPARVNPAPTAYNDDYDSSEHELLTDSGKPIGGTFMFKLDDGEYSEEIPTATNAGEYTITYYVVGDKNHTDSEEAEVTATINKIDPELVTKPMNTDPTYNGAEQELVTPGEYKGGTILYFLMGDEPSEDVPTATNAGKYPVYYYVRGDENHNDLDVEGTHRYAGVTSIIKPLTVTVVPDAKSKVYGAEDPELTYTFDPSSLVPGVTGNIGRNKGEAVGDYYFNLGDLALDKTSEGNFVLSFKDNDKDHLFSITKATEAKVTAPVAKTGLVYNGKAQDLLETPASVEGDETAMIVYQIGSAKTTGMPNAKDAGNYEIEYYIQEDANHDELHDDSWKLTVSIAKAPLTAVPNENQSKSYGAKDPDVFTFRFDGLVNSEGNPKFTGGIAREEGENVGTYAYTAGDLALPESSNYELTFDDAGVTFEITEAQASITAHPKAITLTYTGEPQTLITAGTAKGGKMMYYLTKGEESEKLPSATDAGTYYVYYYVKGDENHADYHHSADKDNAVKVEIAKAQVVVTPKEGQYKIFGDPDPVFEYTYTPTSPDVAVEPQFTGKLDRTIPQGDPVGSYNILQGNLFLTEESAKNFEYKRESTGFTPGVEFEVRQVSAELTKAPVAAKGLVYKGTNAFQKLLEIPGEADGGTVMYEYSRDGKTWGPVEVPAADWAGTYTISYYIQGDENHADVKNDAWTLEVEIAKATVTVTPNADQTKVVGAPDPDTFTFASSGWMGQDTPSLTGKLGREEGENIGSYKFTLEKSTLEFGNDELKHNYELTIADENPFKITPYQEAVTVTLKPNHAVERYNGSTITVPALVFDSATYNGYKEGDFTCTPTVSGKDAAIYQLENVNVSSCKNISENFVTEKITFKLADGDTTATLTIETGEITEDDFTAPQTREEATGMELVYNGGPQLLIVEGETSKGEFQYGLDPEVVTKSLDETTFSSVIPVGTDAGEYTIYYYIDGGNNYQSYGSETAPAGTLKSTIHPKELTADMLDIPVVSYDEETHTVAVKVLLNGREVPAENYVVSGDTTATEVGTYAITVTGQNNLTGSVDAVWEIKDMVNRISMFRIGEPDKVCLRCGVLGGELPATGFPTRVNVPLAVKPQGLDYAELGMRIQIPSLNVDVELAGVPTMDGAWKVEWLADRAGLLSGTALPGDGYSIVAAHNTLNAEEVGPFVLLSTLQDNDTIFVNAPDGSMKLFRVYANELLAPNDMETLASIAEQESNTLVLVTCENESVDGGYLNRRVVFAKPLN